MNKQESSNAAFHLRQHFIYNKNDKAEQWKNIKKKKVLCQLDVLKVRSKSTLSQTQGQDW